MHCCEVGMLGGEYKADVSRSTGELPVWQRLLVTARHNVICRRYNCATESRLTKTLNIGKERSKIEYSGEETTRGATKRVQRSRVRALREGQVVVPNHPTNYLSITQKGNLIQKTNFQLKEVLFK